MSMHRTPPKKKARELAKYLRAERAGLSLSQECFPRLAGRTGGGDSQSGASPPGGPDRGGTAPVLSGRVANAQLCRYDPDQNLVLYRSARE